MVLYFSGTGNSRYVAEIIAKKTGDEVVSINEKIKAGDDVELKSDNPYVFVCPVYAGRIPRVVEKFIRQTAFAGTKKVYFVVTCAETPWITVSYIEKLCSIKGFHILGFNSVIMPQNYIAGAPMKTEEENEKILDKAEPIVERIAEQIKKKELLNTEVPGKKMMSTWLNPIMYATMVSAKGFVATNACKGCGKCAARCPLGNIKMVNGKPQWGKDCTHCMACIGGCQWEAIEYGKKTEGKPRFYNMRKCYDGK